MSEKQKVVVQQRGMGWLGLLGVVFVTLKLLGITEVDTWSWWWVTAPFWAGIAIVIGFISGRPPGLCQAGVGVVLRLLRRRF